jgi:hypothetical protein
VRIFTEIDVKNYMRPSRQKLQTIVQNATMITIGLAMDSVEHDCRRASGLAVHDLWTDI